MKVALGRFGWTPQVFWAARDGWMARHAPRRAGGPLNDEEIETLEDMKRRFPG